MRGRAPSWSGTLSGPHSGPRRSAGRQ
uniref:Uncharacterized protein n=1 Tax=Anguilla anguilla TaxID=7936 RepID=A0A0E9XBU8_ANGAN